MLSFESDYIQGAHINILNRLIETNMEPLSGYGYDEYTLSAKEKIKKACGSDDVDVFLLTGGTQTNQIVIDTMLNSYEGVICADTGHINCHEAGAIEYSRHKVISLPQNLGKISCDTINDYMTRFLSDENNEHTTQPKMVYISHPTEYGTLYSKSELEGISKLCKKYGLYLYMDGARLGYALSCDKSDVSLCDIADLCDVFYIGGTKVGALCGEAVVFKKDNTPKYFFTSIKQHGALLAKGRVLGIQFDTLFTDDLYLKISKHALKMADKLREVFIKKDFEFYIETFTNQIFVVFSNEQIEHLKDKVCYSYWEKLSDDSCVVRFATSWATSIKDIEALEAIF